MISSKYDTSWIPWLPLLLSIPRESSRTLYGWLVTCSYVEQGFFQRWWNEQDANMKALVHKLVDNGQFEFNLGGWVMSDEAAATYEDVINQMTLGAKFIYDEFGVRPTVGWAIDPFGHSKEIEALYADIGMDAFGINRVHYADKADRIKNQKLEFVWRGSNSQGEKSDMFIHMMDNHYCSPTECDFFSNSCGDCMYRKEDDVWFQDNADLPTFKVNAEEKAQAFVDMVKTRATYYNNGNNLLITWGCDFNFLSAPVSYDNMDKLIKYVNDNEDRFGVHVQYAVFSDYIKAVHAHKRVWDVYEGDFMPYASDPDAYWTGYYTSRGRTKGLNRRTMNELAVAELYLSLARVYHLPVDANAVFEKVMKLRKAQGEFQHHDAITGTEKQAVANDYNVQMEDGSFFANEATSTVLGAILDVSLNHNLTLKWQEMGAAQRMGVILTNSNAQKTRNVVRTVVPTGELEVTDASGKTLSYQINDIPDWSIERANGTHVVYVEVEVPALGYTTIYFVTKPSLPMVSAHRGAVVRDDSIENDRYRLTFANGLLSAVELKEEGRTIPFTDKLYQYTGRYGSGRNSGAYSFIPASHTPDVVGDKAELTVIKGPLLEEARVVYRTGYQQVIRLYRCAGIMRNVIEMVYDMGPTDDGREIVARYSSELLKNDRVMFTDGNGLEDIKRVYREDDVEPVSANYYPISNRVWMQSEANDLRFNIVVDRAHGVATVVDGTLEVMLKRRTRGDDWFGVDEPLVENDHYQQTLWLTLGSIKSSVAMHKRLDLHLNHAPVAYYFIGDKAPRLTEKSLLKKDLPENVQMLNFQLNQLHDTDFLLRFHHLYTKGEDTELAQEVIFDVNDYFADFQVTEMTEYGLSGMFTREQIQKERMQWEIDPKMKQAKPMKKSLGETMVDLTPMEFKTYRVRVN